MSWPQRRRERWIEFESLGERDEGLGSQGTAWEVGINEILFLIFSSLFLIWSKKNGTLMV